MHATRLSGVSSELLTALFLHGLAGSGAEWDAMQARVPDAGHDAHLDQPEALADAIQDWTPSTSDT
jgi:hypothetical protein